MTAKFSFWWDIMSVNQKHFCRYLTANLYGFEVVPHLLIPYVICPDTTCLIEGNLNPIYLIMVQYINSSSWTLTHLLPANSIIFVFLLKLVILSCSKQLHFSHIRFNNFPIYGRVPHLVPLLRFCQMSTSQEILPLVKLHSLSFV